MQTQRGRIRLEPSAKRVRVYCGDQAIADTTRPMLVWEVPYYPMYYIPIDDVRTDVLAPSGNTRRSPSRGDGVLYTIKAGGREEVDAALRYPDSPIPELRDLIRFDWETMDAWFEEDEEIIVHPRDPYSRVDILQSSRQVRVEIDGVTVAESSSARLLFETGLPTRYYLPKTAVRFDLLEPSDTVTRCPYKGRTVHWAATVGGVRKDVAWSYPAPLPESQKVIGMVAFYNERTDIYVDGVKQERPDTPWS